MSYLPEPGPMTSMSSRILTLNGGSSSIKFAVFTSQSKPERVLRGHIDRIGEPEPMLTATEIAKQQHYRVPISGTDYRQAAEGLIGWITEWGSHQPFAAVGHRVFPERSSCHRHRR